MSPKDPNDVLDYSLDYRLESDESILISEWTVIAGGVLIGTGDKAPSFSGKSSTVWLSGGTEGTDAIVENQITTSLGRTYNRRLTITIRNL